MWDSRTRATDAMRHVYPVYNGPAGYRVGRGSLPVTASPPRTTFGPDGEPLVFRVLGAERGTPMMTMHGLFSSLHHWAPFLDHYTRDRKVISWEYRGHGGLPAPRQLPTTVAQFADDAHAVWHASGEPPVVLVALSFGVQVAIELWRRHPESVRALVLICGVAGRPLDAVWPSRWLRRGLVGAARTFAGARRVSRRILSVVRSPVGVRVGREVAYLTRGAHRSECPPEVLEGLFRHAGALSPDLLAAGFEAYLEHDARASLASVDVPTMLVATDEDRFAPLAAAERMVSAIPHARLVVFRGYSHLVQVERSDEIHAEIDTFLRDHRL